VRFPSAIRGYRMDLVDEVLDRAAADLAARDAEIDELRAQLRASRAGEY
jgi:DivIVA domain-containing protein